MAAVALLWPAWHTPTRLQAFVDASPFVAISSSVVARAVTPLATIGLVVALIAIVRRRWFCHWVCPAGLCADGAARLGRACRLRPIGVPAIGRWIALATLAGAVVGYPLLLWLDPLALFAGVFDLFARWGDEAMMLSAVGLPAVLLLTLLLPGIWCARLCPLGGLQELLVETRKLVWHRAKRTADQDSATNPHPLSLSHKRARGTVRLARRVALVSLVGLAWAAVTRTVRAAASRPLRPPGALDETTFTGVCLRCGNCLRVCPAAILLPDLGEFGLASFLTPVVHFDDDYCREDCTKCLDACPSGALWSGKTGKLAAPIGFPQIDMNVCLLGNDRDCAACGNACSYAAITFVFSETDYTLTPVIDRTKCPGCGACEVACPTTPKAIVVRPVELP